MTEKKNTKDFKRVWITLLLWLCGMLLLHIICRALHVRINANDMLISNLITIVIALAINWLYTKEKIYFEWYGFKRIGWLLVFALIFIIAINAMFKTVPSATSLEISLSPFFWLFFILASATIPVIMFYAILMPAMIHNWQTSSNVILKSLILSSALFSIFEVFILNNMYGGILSTIYQLVAEFAFGLMCGLFYLRSVNIIVSIFFGFIETFCAVILTHIAPLFGNGIINIIFFLLFIYLVLKIALRPQNIKQIEKDFKLN